MFFYNCDLIQNVMRGKKYIYVHIGAWVTMILPTFLLMFGDSDQIPLDRVVVFVFNTLFTILNFYLFFSFVIPRLYDSNKIWWLVAVTVFFLILYPLFQYEIFVYLQHSVEITWKRVKFKDYFLSQAYSTTLLFTGLAYLSRFSIKWVTDRQKQVELVNQNQTSELALLRSQINPHFLFNTLNNIYSLVLKKSDNAPEAMMKLSEIMRYMLYETNTEKVLLENEVKYLESFIELMQLRLKNKDFIDFKVEGDTTCVLIAPMLLIPFVENAFKHCNKRVKSPGIKIEMTIDKKDLQFKVTNHKKTDDTENIEKAGGIGLNNIKRRLELLYPKKSSIEIFEQENIFAITLKVDLS